VLTSLDISFPHLATRSKLRAERSRRDQDSSQPRYGQHGAENVVERGDEVIRILDLISFIGTGIPSGACVGLEAFNSPDTAPMVPYGSLVQRGAEGYF